MHRGDYRLKHLAEANEYHLLDKKQAAKYLNISQGSLERLMRNGLVYAKVGGLVRFRVEDLQAYVAAHMKGGDK